MVGRGMSHYKSTFYHLTVQPSDRLARLVRGAAPFSSLQEMGKEMDAVNHALNPLRTSCVGLLVDVRLAPARNDPEFERAFEPHRVRLHAGFGRSAVLTKTTVGKMQVQRLGLGARNLGAFVSEPEALAFLLTKLAERSV
jgi:hypothetical protein